MAHTDPSQSMWSATQYGRRYELVVSQQPQRARMCGFGDKDRRAITPPPCIRLIITDMATGKECDVNDIDYSKFVLTVELWSEDGARELNLVRHSATSPTITSASTFSHAQATTVMPGPLSNLPSGPSIPSNAQFRYENSVQYHTAPPPYNPYPGVPQVNAYSQGQPNYGGQHQYQATYTAQYYTTLTGTDIHAAGGSNMIPLPMPPTLQPGVDYGPVSQALPQHSSLSSYGGRPFTQADIGDLHRMPTSATAPVGMFTRNLIGSLSASASRLANPDDRIGIWFILHDLSVRTEGNFRLRFSFVDVGFPQGGISTGRAPVLASCFSDPFIVYSAKKFPGVVESTALSKCFATQGIKIPIRKDGSAKRSRDDDE